MLRTRDKKKSKYLHPDYVAEIERQERELNEIQNLQAEIVRLNNVITDLKNLATTGGVSKDKLTAYERYQLAATKMSFAEWAQIEMLEERITQFESEDTAYANPSKYMQEEKK